MTRMTIGWVARRAGVGVETVRFYERRGLIERPPRPHAGFREYDETTVERIRFIKQAQEMGFSLREAAELLALRADPAADCGDVHARAHAKLADVERRIAQLRRLREALRELLRHCPRSGPVASCSILGAMNGPKAMVGAEAANGGGG